MHEVAIAEAIIEATLSEMEARKLPSVRKIGLRIGALTDVVPDSLRFGFEILTRDTRLAGTELEIEEIPISGKCRECHNQFEISDHLFICPNCQSPNIEVIRGLELDIAYLKVDDDTDRTT